VVTEDGTFGIRGPIQQTVRAVCRHVTDIDRALAVGPMPFLKACANATRNYEIPTTISLNAVIEHEDELTPEGGGEGRFDWHNATDLDGHTADFDKLTEQLGISPVQ
jgi:ferredoxin--NADP+ reductase